MDGRNPEVIRVSEAANRKSDRGEATRILGEKAGWHFQAARASLDDISTESTVRPWSGPAGRQDFGSVRWLSCIFYLTKPRLCASL